MGFELARGHEDVSVARAAAFPPSSRELSGRTAGILSNEISASGIRPSQSADPAQSGLREAPSRSRGLPVDPLGPPPAGEAAPDPTDQDADGAQRTLAAPGVPPAAHVRAREHRGDRSPHFIEENTLQFIFT